MTKEQRYSEVIKVAESLIDSDAGLIANMANISALLQQNFNFWWTGFYLVREDKLILGPFQGPVACTQIAYGKGVCGTSWMRGETVIVPNVDEFPGHIACSSESKSEIVVPVYRDNDIIAVLDIDSEKLNTFDETDRKYLEKVCVMLTN